MNFQTLNDKDLHQKLLSSIEEEKRVLTKVLHLLKEVETRKLYCDFKCKSLFDYATRILKYSEAEAYVRINAMRLIKEIPEVEKSLESGELTLTNVSKAQSHFKKQQKSSKNKSLSLTEKKELIETVKNKSTREVKALLFQAAPEAFPLDSTRTHESGRIEIKFTMEEQNFQRVQDLKNKLSGHGKNIGFEDFLLLLAESFEKNSKTGAEPVSKVYVLTFSP